MRYLLKSMRLSFYLVVWMVSVVAMPVSAEAPVSVHPDLVVPEEAYGPEVLAQLKEELSRLQSLPELEPAAIHIPDYKFAYQVLQSQIALAIAWYLKALDLIRKEVTVYLTNIYSLEVEAQKNDFFRTLLKEEIDKATPLLRQRINLIYSKALKRLYLLDEDSLELPFRPKERVGHRLLNQLGQRFMGSASTKDRKRFNKESDAVPSILSYCETSACTQKLAEDIAQWLRFVDGFNRTVSLFNFDIRKYEKKKKVQAEAVAERAVAPVSYTHLTLPTILLV